MRVAAALTLLLAGGLAACNRSPDGADSERLNSREQEVKKRIAAAASDSEGDTPVAMWVLPDVLREVSGVALTSDGRILAHNDERSRVFVIDPLKGVIVKQFSVGKKGMTADFEAIAVSGDDFFLLTSNGDVYQFREGEDDAEVPFTKHATALGKECEFEALEIERGTGAFIMPCKVIDKKSERDRIRIYRWLAQRGGAPQVSMIDVSLQDARGANDWKDINPSDITIDPKSGNYVLVAGPQKALLEITPAGQVVQSMPAPGKPQQPEGVAITSDGLLIIGDEGVSRPASITIYPWRPGTVPADTTSADTTQASN
ncbi:MAG TPA: SdiA-regulated domain-containing protein [Gemmatimonadaceae bacterium]|nr:SdiA-regulated domain-containing protein [Gemmatimonadaceae bacterium]